MPSSWSGFSRRSTLKTEPSNLTPKKVVHIITRLDHGGSARETLQTVLGHDRGRFRVSIAFGRPETTTADDAALLKADLQQLSQADVSVFQVPPLVREINPVLDAWATVALWRLLRRVRPEVVHTHTSKAGAVGRLAAWLAGIPVVIHTPHGHVFYGYYGSVTSAIIRLLERHLAKRHDIPECLAALDLFVLPSLNEGMGRALIEAMAVGCPVVATRVGGIPDIVADGTTGLLVPPRDDRALAEAILTLLRDRSRRAAYGESARRHVDDRFEVASMVRNIERLYDKVWSEKHPAM